MKKSLKGAYCLGASLLALGLASCGSDEQAAERPQVARLSFKIAVDGTDAPVSRAASWGYQDEYVKGAQLAVEWYGVNNISVFHYSVEEGGWGFNGSDGTPYMGTVSDNGTNMSVTIAEGTKTWKDNDGIVALFPHHDTGNQMTDGTVTLSSPETVIQNGKNTSHLNSYMYMYGTLPCGTLSGNEITAATMRLHHIPAVLRAWVINEDIRERIVKRVEIIASTGFHSQCKVSYTKEDDGNFTVGLTPIDETLETLTITLDNSDGSNWNKLAAKGVADKTDRLMAYTLCFPTATEQDYIFRVITTDADGNNENAYVSNRVLSADLQTENQLKSGYYYTFVLRLDDKLTASVAGVSQIPGWNNDNETELK